ncbi:sirohydrochlorin cobaltochelatase [Roseburia hominis]
MGKKAILVVSFGTSYLDTLKKTITAIEHEIAEEFPTYQVYRAFTSQMILNKLKKQNGLCFLNVREAMEQMRSDGIQSVIIQPTHVINGIEYDGMMQDISGYEQDFESIRVGKPLLSSVRDYKQAVHAVMESVELEPDEALILMGHGTEHHANSAYPTLEYTFHLLGYHQVLVGTVEGFPELQDVLARMEIAGLKKVTLLPFMVVAGDHANNDMAGEDNSWKQTMKDAGYEVRTLIRGLGENPAIRSMFVQHVREAM